MSSDEILKEIQTSAAGLEDGLYAYQQGEIRSAKDAIASPESVDMILIVHKGELYCIDSMESAKDTLEAKRGATPVELLNLLLHRYLTDFNLLSRKLKGGAYMHLTEKMNSDYWHSSAMPNHWLYPVLPNVPHYPYSAWR